MEINQIEINALKAGLGLTLKLSSIGKSYAGRPVLNAIDLNVASGEFLSIIGRSGSGKTTLLRLIAGLEAADGGTLSYDRQAIRKEDIRILFQEARLLPWKTLLENVLLGIQGSKHELYKQGFQILAQVGLAGREHDWPQQLSGGQRQRVALARALIHRPRLLLLFHLMQIGPSPLLQKCRHAVSGGRLQCRFCYRKGIEHGIKAGFIYRIQAGLINRRPACQQTIQLVQYLRILGRAPDQRQ